MEEFKTYLIWGSRAFLLAMLMLYTAKIAYPNDSDSAFVILVTVIISVIATKPTKR
jgi:hypothetical protein